jgi:dipeptidase
MKSRTLILIVLAVAFCGIAGVASQAPPQQKVFASASDPEINIRKMCSEPPPPGVSAAEWELTCDSCTSMPTTKEASADGSVMTSHSCDGHYEVRIHVVSGKKSAPGTMRPIMKGGGLGADRPSTKQVGEIPEIEQTLTRYDAAYPFMNEKQVIMGETTIGGRRELYNDEGLFDIMELQRLALERASTAREAIKVMGEFATKYGYGDWGECLTVGDGNDVWHFEIFGAGAVEKGAVWAAVRIPAGHVGVSANRPRIPELKLEDKDNYLASANVYQVAKDMGWWKEGEPFVFHKAYGGGGSLGSTRREWRVLSTVAPSLKLDPWDQNPPFTVKAEIKVGPRDLIRLHRDYYQGTDFDASQGGVAGPFSSPNRWGASTRPPEGFMGFERTISVHQCSYTTVIQARNWMPAWIGGVVWFANDDAKTSPFAPLYAGNTRIPEAYEIGTRAEFDRRSAWWSSNFVGNWANLNFGAMIQDIREAYTGIEDRLFAQQPAVEKVALELYKQDPNAAREYITGYSNRVTKDTIDAWWKLADTLVVKYQDAGGGLAGAQRQRAQYPKDWLEKNGYGTMKNPNAPPPAVVKEPVKEPIKK